MIEDRNIICFASNWSYDPTSKHHIMRLLAERNQVIWVNYHGSRRPRLSGADAGAIKAKLRQVIEGPRQVARNITVVTPLVVPMPGSRAVTALNGELLTRQIRSLLWEMPEQPAQLWTFAPDVAHVCGQFDEECVVYYCVDEFSEFSGYDAKQVRADEARLAKRADLVVATSQALFESKRHLNGNVVLVPHGVDYQHFEMATTADTHGPADVADLPRPLLGFWGLIQDWVDVELLRHVAEARPSWSIVLIGEALADVDLLARMPNVHLLGRKPYRQLPAYAKAFDIGLIPFRVNALTRAVNPIKLREYLSAGLPVVSTPLPEVARYGDLVRIADGSTEFVRACEEMLGEHTADGGTARGREAQRARQEAMRNETWRAKVEEVCEHIRRSMASRAPAMECCGAVAD